jgi:phosphoribosylanthranilate isomerase
MTTTDLKVKVCGMRESLNVTEVAALKPDYIGFIFYFKSPRFVGALDERIVQSVRDHGVEPVAVFVDASVEFVMQKVELYGFTCVQLHGHETPETCAALKAEGLKVLKAFSIADVSDLKNTFAYEDCCDFFLFDTKTSLLGGSGCQFDWNILKEYAGTVPFFLSGGIGPEDAEKLRPFHHPLFYGIDLNSRFETQPAMKDAVLLRAFFNQLTYDK